jgi:hypothetical protein
MELAQILYQKTNDQLKQLATFCSDCRGMQRKDDLVRCIRQSLLTPGSLRQLWQRLDDLSKKAVAAAYHNEGEFNESAFVAQYGKLPKRSQSPFLWQQPPILLDLFIYNGSLPTDLMPLLENLAPSPDKFQVQGVAEVPEEIKWLDGQRVKLIRAETELAGRHDLIAYLRLVAGGELNAGSSSGPVPPGGLKKIVQNLLLGDFLPHPENYRAAQIIRPVGLDMFARGAGLVDVSYYSGMRLTELGQQFYQTQTPELLLEAFETWSQQGYFDELTRISGLKGLKSNQTRLTKPAGRREKIIEALSWCPAGVWIDIRDFYRAIKIWHFDFDVETTLYSNLYVGYRDYGMLYGEDYWKVIKGLYINVVLWEYLGSIGALDLLYTEPEYAAAEAYVTYLRDSDDYLSLYDGLRYFRINPLGAYLLGQAAEYIPSRPLNPPLFCVSADMTLTVAEPGQLTPNDEHLLALVTIPLAKGRYRLDTQQFLTTLESGSAWQDINDFLVQRHQGPLPGEVLAWLDQVQQKSQAFKRGGRAIFIKANKTDLVEMAMADPILQKFCHRIDRRTLVIPANKENAFRSRLKELEYVLLT